MPATDPPAGIVMAGGRGARLGGEVPKPWARLAGVTLLERALAALGPHVRALHVAAPAGVELPGSGYLRVDDVPGAGGPLAGLCPALEAVGRGTALVMGVDYPLVRPELLAFLAAHPARDRIVAPRVAGRLQPLLARYPAAAAKPLRRVLERGEAALVAAVLEARPCLVEEDELRGVDPDLRSFLNVNTAAALAAAERALAGAQA